MNRGLFEKAKAVRDKAHAPYSHFHVGVALRTTTGEEFVGANVENASYPEGNCAETSAIAAMVAGTIAGTTRRIAEITVVASRVGGRLTTPCGGCRQRIAEFASASTPVHIVDPEGEGETVALATLLPGAFSFDEKAG